MTREILEKRLKRTVKATLDQLIEDEIEFPKGLSWIEESWEELKETVEYLPEELLKSADKLDRFLTKQIRDKNLTPQNDVFDFIEMESKINNLITQIQKDQEEKEMNKLNRDEFEDNASDIYVTEEYDPDESIFSVGYVLDEIPRSIMVKAADEKEAYDKVKKQYPTAEIFGAKKELNVEEMIKRGKPILEELSDDVKVREWYVTAFPNDELGFGINPDITFTDLNKVIEDGLDVYDLLTVQDNIIRERLFDKLAELTGVSYDDIFEKWVNTNPEAAKDGFEAEVKEKETKEESLTEALDAEDYFKSLGIYDGDGKGAFCVVDEQGEVQDTVPSYVIKALIDTVSDGSSQVSTDGEDWYEIEFDGDCDWDEAQPYILKALIKNKIKGIFNLE